MQLRNTLVMALILVLVGGFVYFYEIRGREARELAEEEAQRFLHFEPADVAELTLQRPDQTIVLRRQDDGWRMTEPVATDADGTAVDSLLQQLSQAQQERVVMEEAGNLDPYGLSEPRFRATVRLREEADEGDARDTGDGGEATAEGTGGETAGDGAREQTLELGKQTPVGMNVYVKRSDEPAVYIAASSLQNSLDKTVYDLRDKNVLRFADADVRGLHLQRGSLAARIRREPAATGDEPEWQIVEPIAEAADSETVSELLRRLRTDEAESFVVDDATEADLGSYGLSEPRARVAVVTEGDATQTLLIGARSEDPAGHYALREGGTSVFVVPDGLVGALPGELDDLRDRSILTASRDRISALEFRNPAGRFRLEKADDEWSIVEPRRLDADSSRVSTLISDLVGLRAEEFAESGRRIDDPWATLTLRIEPPERGGDAGDAGQETPADGEAGEEEIQTPGGTDEGAAAAETVEIRIGERTRIEPSPGADEQAEDAEGDDAGAEETAGRLVATSASPAVYVVAEEDLEGLSPDLFDLRAKTLVEFSQSDLTRLEIDSGEERFVLTGDGDGWSLESPESRDVEEQTVSDLLWDLNYLRMAAVAAEWTAASDAPPLGDFGLDAPRATIRAYIDDEPVATVQVGGAVPADRLPDDASPGDRYYARVGDDTAIYQIDGALPESVDATLQALRSEG